MILVLPGCTARGGSNNSGDDDDDSAGDDDDATQGDDDDATQGDDDDSVAEPELTAESDPIGSCSGGGDEFEDSEPNNGEPWLQNLGTPTAGFCVNGTIVCGNDEAGYVGDLDNFAFAVPAGASATFSLTWEGSDSDMDMYVLDQTAGKLLHDFEDGVGGPEGYTGSLAPETVYLVAVGCWLGSANSYLLTVDW